MTARYAEAALLPAGFGQRPAFLITIDTEADNCWARPRETTTRNARFLPRFQSLCEQYGLKPTYLVTWEMAHEASFLAAAREWLERGTCEIGMHLHAWNSPPHVPLTADDSRHQPFLIEYDEPTIRAKVARLTEHLRETFDAPVISHRAGRWALDERYARVLIEHGYRVDCSVTPHVSWGTTMGDPAGRGGSDYRTFPEDPYYVDPEDLGRPGCGPLLEVPMTIRPSRRWVDRSIGRTVRWLRRGRAGWQAEPVDWLRPNGRNRSRMLRLLEMARWERRSCVEFMLHSSELMPGGSPRFPTARAVEQLYAELNDLFGSAQEHFVGMTLAEFEAHFRKHADPGPNRTPGGCPAAALTTGMSQERG